MNPVGATVLADSVILSDEYLDHLCQRAMNCEVDPAVPLRLQTLPMRSGGICSAPQDRSVSYSRLRVHKQ